MLKNNDSYLELQARPDLIDIIHNVAKDKNILVEEVFVAMETALQKVALVKYGELHNIEVIINRIKGAILVQRIIMVVDVVEDHYKEITVLEAKRIKADAVLGDELRETLPPLDFDRNYVQSFRQGILHKIKEAEKEREYEAYKDKVGELVSGIVKRVEMGNLFVELSNKAEAFLRRDNCIQREYFEVGSKVRALITEVKRDPKAQQIMLSRTHPNFIRRLFEQEIPEVYEGVISTHGIARDPGSRSKIAVSSKDPSIDAIGTCVGFKGSRIQGVLAELKGEKIDLIHYSDNVANYVINAFYPSEVLKIIVYEDKKTVSVVMKSDNLSMAIGRGGQNINLISRLVGWHIDLMSEEDEKEMRQKSIHDKTTNLINALDVDEVIAQLLVAEGFNTVEDIIGDKGRSLSSIAAFNDDIIEELTDRAKAFIEEIGLKMKEEIANLGVSQELINLINNDEVLVCLGKNGVKTIEDMGDLSIFELIDMLPKDLIDTKEAEELIMKARNID